MELPKKCKTVEALTKWHGSMSLDLQLADTLATVLREPALQKEIATARQLLQEKGPFDVSAASAYFGVVDEVSRLYAAHCIRSNTDWCKLTEWCREKDMPSKNVEECENCYINRRPRGCNTTSNDGTINPGAIF